MNPWSSACMSHLLPIRGQRGKGSARGIDEDHEDTIPVGCICKVDRNGQDFGGNDHFLALKNVQGGPMPSCSRDED